MLLLINVRILIVRLCEELGSFSFAYLVSKGKLHLHFVRISKLSMEKLEQLVGPYLIPEMLYKLGIKK